MAYEFRQRRMVEFAETDMAGILHFANYFRYMEEVEHAFFRSLGLSVHSGRAHPETGITYGWARGKAECSYHAPLRYEDTVELHILVREKRAKSIRYEIRFLKDNTEVARGNVVAVCVALPRAGERMRATTMPAEVRAALDEAPAAPG